MQIKSINVTKIGNSGPGLTTIIIKNKGYYIFQSEEDAGKYAEEYYRSLAENTPEEFATIIGASTLIAWCLGQSAGPGAIATNSLEDWLTTVVANNPEEFFNTETIHATIDEELCEELSFDSTNIVLYRV